MEVLLRIHKDKQLPPYVTTTFPKWYSDRLKRNRRRETASEATGKVALFSSCLVDYSFPSVGRAAVDVLQHNRVEVVLPTQQCCGMPSMSVGDLPEAITKARANIEQLLPWIDRGYCIVTPMPSCSLMLKKEYPYLVGTAEAQRVGEATSDLCEFLMRLHSQGKLRTDFVRSGGTIAYHLPCHLRDQKLGYKSRDLMALIPEAKVEVIEWCSGHDGTWSMDKDNFPISMKVGQRVFDRVNQQLPDVVASDCSLAGTQILQATGKPVSHPIEVIHRAYGLDERAEDYP